MHTGPLVGKHRRQAFPALSHLPPAEQVGYSFLQTPPDAGGRSVKCQC